MAIITIKAGQTALNYTGPAALALAGQTWYTSQNIGKVFIPTANNLGWQSGQPGSSFGVTSVPPAPVGRRSSLVLVAKQDFTLDDALFGGSSIYPRTVPFSVPAGEAETKQEKLLLLGDKFRIDPASIVFTTGSGSVLFSLNDGAYKNAADFNAQMAGVTDDFSFQSKVVHTGLAEGSYTLISY